jgi:potassium-transporting ATPase potassium-binding subunit
MTISGWLQIALFSVIVILITRPLGGYMTRVFAGERTFLSPVLQPIERAVYWCCGVDEKEEQHWLTYAVGVLLFSVVGFVSLYALQRLQWYLPFNPQEQTGVEPSSAFNTSVSFVTNTNWQSYVPEQTVSNFTQMVGLAVHNFTSAAIGVAIAVALVRGFARREVRVLGNFWADLVRAVLYVFLPISLVGALVLVWQGVPQTLAGTTTVQLVEPATYDHAVHAVKDDGGNPVLDAAGNPLTESVTAREQTLTVGPWASQELIKELGTNGGGTLNANSSHPFEGPTPFATFFEIFLLLVIPSALALTFGHMVGDARQGWALWAAMAVLFVLALAVAQFAEHQGNPLLAARGVSQTVPGGSMEGKEVRFGTMLSALFAVATTVTSCGAVNTMHDSLIPMAGFVPMLDIQLGEVVFGGTGAGLYGILIFAVLAVFLAGLMVGRTPEYLGKKIESFDVKMAMLTVLVLPLSILGFAALAAVLPVGTATLNNPGAHGFSELLYAYTSQTGNNGSAFAGIGANTPFYNTTGGLAMLIGRFAMIVPILALAGSLAAKKRLPPSLGTFPTTGGLWVGLLVGVVLIVGALTYFPALALGPIVDQLQLNAGKIVEAGAS